VTEPKKDISGLDPEEFEDLKKELKAQLDGQDKDVEEKLEELRRKQKKRIEDSPAWFLDFPGLRVLEREFWRSGCLLSESVRSYVRDSKGFMTQDGELLDYSEWHSVVYGFGAVALSYLIHPVFLFFVVQVGHRLGEDAEGSLGEVIDEVPYFLAGAGSAGVLFEFGLGMSLQVQNSLNLLLQLAGVV